MKPLFPKIKLPVQPPYPPMEAQLVPAIPAGPAWQYEPKWDGFRCLIFRDGETAALQSKAGQPLGRYFPELLAGVGQLKAKRFVLDGEIVIPVGARFSFDQLLLRIHPAASRVQKLAAEHPALFVAFDLLVDAQGESLVAEPLRERRQLLEAFSQAFLHGEQFRLSPATRNLRVAQRWLKSAGSDLDGIVAKRLDLAYGSGERTGMEKVKPSRTVDCVVGGFRYGAKKTEVGSLLLGLYDEAGLLHHVGFCSGLKRPERKDLLPKLQAVSGPPGFTGRAPGGPSRWSAGRSTAWEPLKPVLVLEVAYDHFTGGRFRHGARLIRWRPDKAPAQCQMDQVARTGKAAFRMLTAKSGR